MIHGGDQMTAAAAQVCSAVCRPHVIHVWPSHLDRFPVSAPLCNDPQQDGPLPPPAVPPLRRLLYLSLSSVHVSALLRRDADVLSRRFNVTHL